MEIFIFETEEELFENLSKYLIKRINEKPNMNLGLATGSTQIPLYEKLVDAYNNQIISFKEIKSFNLDEYLYLKNYKDSYHYFMKTHFFNHVDILEENTYIPNGFTEDANNEIIKYDRLLKENKIDLQVLGIGTNGHVGFCEPGVDF